MGIIGLIGYVGDIGTINFFSKPDMKILVILISHEMHPNHRPYVEALANYMKEYTVDYCGISNQNDFHNYESIIPFKYKIINPKRQLSKVCDFITEYKSELNYDWYIKFRPDMLLLDPINFDMLSDTAVNARAREYIGPKIIKYGKSFDNFEIIRNGGHYDKEEKHIILDDMIYIFHNNVVKLGGFESFPYTGIQEAETFQTNLWTSRKIGLNVVGINALNTKYNYRSGDIIM